MDESEEFVVLVGRLVVFFFLLLSDESLLLLCLLAHTRVVVDGLLGRSGRVTHPSTSSGRRKQNKLVTHTLLDMIVVI